jgi:hypothetical protein
MLATATNTVGDWFLFMGHAAVVYANPHACRLLVAGTDLQLSGSVKRGLVHNLHISLCIHQHGWGLATTKTLLVESC